MRDDSKYENEITTTVVDTSSNISNSNNSISSSNSSSFNNNNNGNEDKPLVPKKFLPIPSFMNVVKTFAGAGTFGLPGAMVNAGLWIGSIGFLLMALLCNYTMNLLLKCLIKVEDQQEEEHQHQQQQQEEDDGIKNKTKKISYADITFKAYGRIGELIMCFVIFLVTMCICVSYLILIGQNLGLIAKISYAPMIWIILPFVLLLTFLTDMKYLGPTSVIGIGALVLAMITIIYYGVKDNYVHPISEYKFDYRNLPLWFGSAAFFFCDHICIIPVSHSSGDNKKFPRVMDIAMVFVTILNIAFAVVCYLYYNFSATGVTPSIIDVLSEGVLSTIVRVSVIFEIGCSFPLVFESGVCVLDSSIKLFHQHFNAFPSLDSNSSKKPFFSRNWKFYLCRIILCSILAGLASSITNFGLFTSLVGSLMLATVGITFPPILYIKLFPNQSKPYKIIHIIISIFGIFATGLGTYLSIKAFVDYSK